MPPLNSVVVGSGVPLVVVHGAGTDHRELLAALEPVLSRQHGIQRIYVDLPGMGRSAAAPADTVAESIAELVDSLDGDDGFLILGHSLGGYFARAVATLRSDTCRGLALLCPVTESTDVPPHQVVEDIPGYDDILGDESLPGFTEYFVRHTPDLARRYRDAVLPGTEIVDQDGLARLFDEFRPDEDRLGRIEAPVLAIAGRQDSVVGWRGTADLADRYPASTLIVCDGAGHALPHERPELLTWAISDWLDRAVGSEATISGPRSGRG